MCLSHKSLALAVVLFVQLQKILFAPYLWFPPYLHEGTKLLIDVGRIFCTTKHSHQLLYYNRFSVIHCINTMKILVLTIALEQIKSLIAKLQPILDSYNNFHHQNSYDRYNTSSVIFELYDVTIMDQPSIRLNFVPTHLSQRVYYSSISVRYYEIKPTKYIIDCQHVKIFNIIFLISTFLLLQLPYYTH